MNHYAIIDAAGQVIGRGATPAPLRAIAPPPGGRVMPLAADTLPGAALFFDGMMVRQAPPAPSPYHRLPPRSRVWQLDEEAAWTAVRAERDRRIAATDWRVVRAQEEGGQMAPEWQAYRQALRDITEQPDPLAIAWPAAPT